MTRVQVFCFLASYGVAFVLELVRLVRRGRIHRFVLLGFGSAGFIAHTLYLVNRGQQTHLPPLLSSTADWALVLAWLIVLLYLFFTWIQPELPLGAFTLPVVLLFIAATYFMPEVPGQNLDARRGVRMLHASLLVFGMGGVCGGFVAGLMYLVQHHRLRTRVPSRTGWSMPSLEKLAQLNRWSVMIAFPLLTLGFATGVVLIQQTRTAETHISFADPTVIVSGGLWILLAVVFIRLLSMQAPGGKHVAWLTLCGCGFLLMALLGLQIITGVHAQRPTNPPRGTAWQALPETVPVAVPALHAARGQGGEHRAGRGGSA